MKLQVFLVPFLVFLFIGYCISTSGPTPLFDDVMEFKFNQSIDILDNDNDNDTVYVQGIKEGLEAIFINNMVILPTKNDGTSNCLTCQLFNRTIDLIDRFISSLSFHISSRRGEDLALSRSLAIQARNFVQLTKESMMVIGATTQNCNPASADIDTGCRSLNVADTAGNVFDPLAPNTSARHPFQGSREVRSPFFISSTIFNPTAGNEATLSTPALYSGQCSAILKEFRGIKVRVQPVTLPIWVSPWLSIRPLLNSQLIWTWTWEPAEYIKTISICNCNGVVGTKTTVATQIVLDNQLLYFWKLIGIAA